MGIVRDPYLPPCQVGDTSQLAPTVLAREALVGGLGVSLMERAAGERIGSYNYQQSLSNLVTLPRKYNNFMTELLINKRKTII